MPDTQPQSPALILVVDDEEIIQEVMRDLLKSLGYEVDTESNGEAALAQIKSKQYAVVFADIRMSRMDGLEFLRRVKHLKPELDVVMMTGYATVDTAVEAMKLGALDFITKPFHPDHIGIVAARAIERQALKRQAEEVEYYKRISLTDGLTELYNHSYFLELLGIELSRSKRNKRSFCLLMIDVDDFKSYNDSLGHPAGNEALKFLAWLLKHHARMSDIVCRYGGEEFSIILPETGRAEGKTVAERLHRTVEKTEFAGQETMPSGNLTISVGLACYPDDAKSADELILNADQALYKAKRQGKNQLISWSEMRGAAAKAQRDT